MRYYRAEPRSGRRWYIAVFSVPLPASTCSLGTKALQYAREALPTVARDTTNAELSYCTGFGAW